MPSYRFLLAGFSVLLLTAQVTVVAQGTAPRAEPVRTPAGQAPGGYFPQDRMEMVDPDKKLGAGDELMVEIEQDREGGFPKVVTATGEIEVRPLGYVKVQGKTTNEAAADIKRQLEKDYYHTATVRLSIVRVSRSVVTAGQITMSGEVRIQGPLSLIAGDKLTVSQAVLKSGGFAPFANERRVEVTRGKERFQVDVKEILSKGLIEKDVPVQDGDRIFVPKVWGKI